MKRFLTLAVLMFLAVGAKAGGVFDVGYSSMAVVGHDVTTGTAVNVLRTRPDNFAYNVAQVRIQNQDATHAIWCGHRPDVSLGTTATLGERIAIGASATYYVGKDPKRSGLDPQIHCIAATAAGTSLVKVSVVWFGH